MGRWEGLKTLVVSNDGQPPDEGIQEEDEAYAEQEDVNSLKSDILRLKKGRCRTPMGSYCIPPGGKPLTSLGFSCPGPADYTPKFEPTKGAAPVYSIVGKPKIRDIRRNLPPPSKYNTCGDISWKDKTVTLKRRNKSMFDIGAEKTQSVIGKYNPKNYGVGTEGPKCTMGKRTNVQAGLISTLINPVDVNGFVTPGPSYRPNSSYWGRGPKAQFGMRTKLPAVELPGPGYYDTSGSVRGPSKSFGIKLPEPVFVQQTVNKESPAANTYDIGTTIGKAPAYSIGDRLENRNEEKHTPGPGTYQLERKAYDRYKAKTLAYRWFEEEERPQPGPADYNVQHVSLKTAPSYTCRQRVKTGYPDSTTSDKVGSDDPGPAAYNIVKEFKANHNPSYSLGKRLAPLSSKEDVPGPNAYQSEAVKPGAKRAPSFSMAKRLAPLNSMKNTPGPGEYAPKLLGTEKGKYTMTRRPKSRKGKSVNPGPNVYKLPELITGKGKGAALKSRASPYVYSGFRTNKLADPCTITLPVISN